MALHAYKDEIFTTGTHEGFKATTEVLLEIFTNFNTYRNDFRVPLKLGHDDAQPITDGEPALGWLDSVSLDHPTNPTTLFAHYVDMPKIVFTAIKNKMYRSRSIELESQIRDGRRVSNILTAVALLGSTLPRVEKLSDLGKYFTKGADTPITLNTFIVKPTHDTSIKRVSQVLFSVKTKPGASIMTPEEIIALQAKLAAEQAKNADLTSANTALATDKETFARKDKERVEAEAAALIVSKRKEVTDLLEAAVKDERITPAKRTMFSKVLRIDDDASVVGITISDVEALVGKDEGTETFSRKSTASDEGNRDDDDKDLHVSERLSRKVFAHMEVSKSTFEQSTAIILKTNPKLAAEYIDSNGEA